MSSVSSNTSPSGSGGRISSGAVDLVEAVEQGVDVVLAVGCGRSRRRRGRRRRLWRGAGAGFAAGNRRRRNIGHGRALAAGGCRLRRGRRAGGLFGNRRLGFVVGDDATDRRQNLLHRGFLDLCRLRHRRLHIINALLSRFTPSQTGFAGSGDAGRDFHRTSLTCPQIKRRSTHRAGSRPCSGHRSVAASAARCGANRPAAPENGMSWQQLIASKRAAPSTPRERSRRRPVVRPAMTAWRSAAVGRANAEPAVADLVIMHARVVDRGGQLEHDRRQPADRVQHGSRTPPRDRAAR